MTQEELERTQAQQRRIEWLVDENHRLRQEIAEARLQAARLAGLCEGLREAAKFHKQPKAAQQPTPEAPRPTQAALRPWTDDDEGDDDVLRVGGAREYDEYIYQQLRKRKTYEEIAKYVGKSISSIYQWTSRRGIRAHRNRQGVYYSDTIGRFLPSTLEKYEKRQ